MIGLLIRHNTQQLIIRVWSVHLATLSNSFVFYSEYLLSFQYLFPCINMVLIHTVQVTFSYIQKYIPVVVGSV